MRHSLDFVGSRSETAFPDQNENSVSLPKFEEFLLQFKRKLAQGKTRICKSDIRACSGMFKYCVHSRGAKLVADCKQVASLFGCVFINAAQVESSLLLRYLSPSGVLANTKSVSVSAKTPCVRVLSWIFYASNCAKLHRIC